MTQTPRAFITDVTDTVDPTVNDDVSKAYDVRSLWVNSSNGKVWFCTDASAGAAVWVDVTESVGYQLGIGGCLEAADLPLSKAGIEIISSNTTLTRFQARRSTPETSGTTTIQLELNGTLIGTSLSWTSADAANAIKTTTISQAVVIGDELSIRLTAAGVGAEDIHAEVQ